MRPPVTDYWRSCDDFIVHEHRDWGGITGQSPVRHIQQWQVARHLGRYHVVQPILNRPRDEIDSPDGVLDVDLEVRGLQAALGQQRQDAIPSLRSLGDGLGPFGAGWDVLVVPDRVARPPFLDEPRCGSDVL